MHSCNSGNLFNRIYLIFYKSSDFLSQVQKLFFRFKGIFSNSCPDFIQWIQPLILGNNFSEIFKHLAYYWLVVLALYFEKFLYKIRKLSSNCCRKLRQQLLLSFLIL